MLTPTSTFHSVKKSHHAWVDQHSVGLDGMRDAYLLRPQALDRGERLAVEVDQHHQRFAGMPDHVDMRRGPA